MVDARICGGFHDPEGFSTAGSTRSFGIMGADAGAPDGGTAAVTEGHMRLVGFAGRRCGAAELGAGFGVAVGG